MMTDERPRLVQTMRYDRAAEAIDWLCEAFGFERAGVFSTDDGRIEHAQLSFPGGMVMLADVSDGSSRAYDRTTAQPRELDGRNTSAAYIVVDDADAHHARAIAAGATVIEELRTEDYGGRGYTCADLEGFVWSFGTYDPWAASSE